MNPGNTVFRNIFANYLGRSWGIISVYIFIPLYLKILGTEAYGLIGIYATIQGIFALADIGLTASLNREMARLSALRNSDNEMGDLLKTYESLYLAISILIVIATWFSTPLLAKYWLHPKTFSTNEIQLYIRLMGFATAIQLSAGLYNGGLLGLQKQVIANYIQISWGILRNAGAIAMMLIFSPTILTFLIWQTISNAIYLFFNRHYLWKMQIKITKTPAFSKIIIEKTWKYALGTAGISASGIILMNIDKIALGKLLSLETFGYYTIASTLSTIPILLSNPIILAIFPKFTSLREMNKYKELIKLYHESCTIISSIITPIGLTIAFFSAEFIYIWTGSKIVSQNSATPASLLTLGQIIQVLTITPFYYALSHGKTKLLLYIQLLFIAIITPLLIYLIPTHGMVGGAASWLIANMIIFPPYMHMLHKRFLPKEFKKWITNDTLKPLLISSAALLAIKTFTNIPQSRMIALLYLTAIAIATTSITIITNLTTKNILKRHFNPNGDRFEQQ